MEENPFPNLKITPFDFLESENRRECSKCGKSRKYYCYSCYSPVKGTEDKVPRIKLPVSIDIIKHPGEVDGKSTAAHAAVLAPEDVKVYTYPTIPDYLEKSKVILIFPGQNSVTLEQLAKDCEVQTTSSAVTEEILKQQIDSLNSDESALNCVKVKDKPMSCDPKHDGHAESQQLGSTSADDKPTDGSTGHNRKRSHDDSEGIDKQDEELCRKKSRRNVYKCPFNKVVFIDSTWNQTTKIFIDERLQGLKQVELKSRDTKFWRHQRNKPSTYLATIEAIYYFLRDFHNFFIPEDYTGQYDDLLFFFCFMYQKIKNLYNGGKELKAYKK